MILLLRILKASAIWLREDRHRGREMRKLRRQKKALVKAKKLADRRALATGKKQWVLPDHRGQLKVLNRTEIQVLKRFKVMNRHVTGSDLDREALYVAQMSNRKFLGGAK